MTIVALGVAAYGAILSTILAIYQVRRDRRKLKVLAKSLLWIGTEAGETYYLLEVRAVNDGHRPIEVRQAVVRRSAKRNRLVPEPRAEPAKALLGKDRPQVASFLGGY